MLTKLQVINAMLGSIGESPLNDFDDEENELLVQALQLYDRVLEEVLSEGWWFNTEDAVLSYDTVSKRVKIPNDVLTVRAANPNYVARGLALYDVSKGDYVQQDTAVELIRLLPIEEIPTPACYLVESACSLAFIRYYDADTSKINQLNSFYQKNRADTMRMHNKCRRSNVLMNPSSVITLSKMGRHDFSPFTFNNRFGIPKGKL